MHFIKNIAEQQQLNIKPLENSVTQQQPSTTHCTTLFLRTPILSTRIRNTDENTPVETSTKSTNALTYNYQTTLQNSI